MPVVAWDANDLELLLAGHDLVQLTEALNIAAIDRQNAVAEPGNRSTRRCLTQDEVRRYNVVNG